MKEAVGIDDTKSPERARRRLAEALEGEDASEAVTQRIAEVIGITEARSGAEESFTAVRTLFEGLARQRPLVLVFDDIHWGAATFLDLIEHLSDWSRGASILLICIARPELLDLRPGWGGGKLNATSALLEPLSAEQCSALIENLVGQAELAESVRDRIADTADGNPLFVEEMLSTLVDDGLLVDQKGRWTARGDISKIRVPPTIQALLAARLDRLGEDERAVIERGAVQGKVFFEDAVAALLPAPHRPAVADALRSLVRKELIRPDRPALGTSSYRFRHLLIRDAAYESIPKEARAKLHEHFGRWLDGKVSDRTTEYEEIVGYHLEQACLYRTELGAVDDTARVLAREAAERLGAAGRWAFIRSDAPAGLKLISRSIALLPPEDPLRVELIPNVRVIQGTSGDVAWADRVLTQAIETAATTGDRSLAAHALVQRALLRLFTEPDVTADELLDVAERTIHVFNELEDELGLTRGWRLKAQAHYLARQAGASAEAAEQALLHVRRTEDRFEEREIVEWLIIALFLGPAPAVEATERCERLLAEASGDRVLEVHALGALAFLVAMQGRLDEARGFITRGRRTMEDLGEWIWLFSLHVAFVALWERDPVTAERELRPSYEWLKRVGEKRHFNTIAQLLAEACLPARTLSRGRATDPRVRRLGRPKRCPLSDHVARHPREGHRPRRRLRESRATRLRSRRLCITK